MKDQILQIGEKGADIEMHIIKAETGNYFVSFKLFKTDTSGIRTQDGEGSPVIPFRSVDEIHEKYGSMMAGQKVTI